MDMEALINENEELKKEKQAMQEALDALTKKLDEVKIKKDDDKDDEDDVVAKRKSDKKKQNKLADIRKKLKDGKLTKDMYSYLKEECNTKTTQNNVVKAFLVYKKDEEQGELTFDAMLKEMEGILGL